MSKHKYTNAICVAIVIVMLLGTVAFVAGGALGTEAVRQAPLYAQMLFATNRVHTIDLVVRQADWDAMLASAQQEEYIQCSVVIDGHAVKNTGLRTKGNSSLASVARSDSDRYSFKIEFDHYEKGKSYYGLDKLVLNNVVQDNTYMKDYVSYQMMNALGVAAPLSSFIKVTVNGNDWGLYLAVEGVEEAFAQRVYGSGYGRLYKPDSMALNQADDQEDGGLANKPQGEVPQGDWQPPAQGEVPQGDWQPPAQGEVPQGDWQPRAGGEVSRGFGGRGANSAVALVYTDDDPDSYAEIFDNSVFKIDKTDESRLIAALKALNANENIEKTVDTDAVTRYFAAHNFVLNSDSYTGSLTHNYYLYEKDGQLSMVAWDYNLAFGGMGGMREATTGSATQDQATALVNTPIDSPMLSGNAEDKPMIAWMFADGNAQYLAAYHGALQELTQWVLSGRFAALYDSAIKLIAPYVKADPTAFCTYEEFEKGSAALRAFCLLRAESIAAQLNGSIAATAAGQTETKNAGFVDAGDIDLQSMGSNTMNFARDGDEGNERFRTRAANGGAAQPGGTVPGMPTAPAQ
ncbi:MAG: CotH kinase family protein [Oscillospiraceae bacterium]|jgi:spore coat protein CotH|nr:CotH kinase family protein [Oscillospiraceae bacterium]